MRRLVGRVSKYDCDRCGKKEFCQSSGLEKPSDDVSVDRGASVMLPIVEGKELSFQTKDLCGDCVMSLSDWMQKRPST